ncbi:GNAT family N-acetyltransferase [Ktedonosporobacter rubrisoli]|uniref:GNAT family N-acetyltransferase n=1 Tax=Ktedonosporobacter rubrisoli TaxID=2509675 RepID=A0A4P6JSE1_KTERU|nr:GNAT family N-acetyltransferase [Ktedonosporobacter rubrisoli]QBD78439.1 GNAT family N-acetyltransferase [Ktedonosporobacter rubrisoli]
MHLTSVSISRVKAQDALIWLKLCYRAKNMSLPDDTSDLLKLFLSAPAEVAANRFLAWLGDRPIAGWRLERFEDVVEIKDLFVLREYISPYGSQIINQLTQEAARPDEVLLIYGYPEAYNEMLRVVGFKVYERMIMLKSLHDYQIQIANLPPGLHLRAPRSEDEQLAASLAYQNYQGTIDQEMICSSENQASMMMHDIFGGTYCRFDRQSSFLLEDEQGKLIGNIFLGNRSSLDLDKLMWILDVSLSPQWRGKGLGRALLIHSLNAAKIKGYSKVGLIVTVGNASAIALYRALHFHRHGDSIYEAVLRCPPQTNFMGEDR